MGKYSVPEEIRKMRPGQPLKISRATIMFMNTLQQVLRLSFRTAQAGGKASQSPGHA